MPTVVQTLDIPASQERVWEVATNWRRYGEWNATHTGFPDGLPPAEPGGKFKERIAIMGMPGEASWTVTELAAPTRSGWHGEGPMGISPRSLLT
jgi:Polyketide cyclase / dehydrase and lipid transport